MSDKDLQRFRYYEKLMKQARKVGTDREKPESCPKCPNYQPEFRYRKCLYAQCPFHRDEEIFRKYPLREDVIPGPEVVSMDV